MIYDTPLTPGVYRGNGHAPTELRGNPLFDAQQNANSCPPLGEGAVRNGILGGKPEWRPRKLSELQSTNIDVSWVWKGYIGQGMTTLFTALWKSGKTTLLANLLKGLDGNAQDFAGQAVRPTKVLVVSEEDAALWAERRDELDIGDHVSVICRPFLGKPRLEDWDAFITYLCSQIDNTGWLVVLDSLPSLWPVKDENAASEVITALLPLYRLTKMNAAVLLLAHPKKGDAGEGQATRGSGAIGGFVDIIIEMRRHDAERREDTRRELLSYSRYSETPLELVIEFSQATNEYTVIGTKSAAKAADRTDAVLSALRQQPHGKTVEEARAAWTDESIPKPGERTIRRDLERAVAAGKARTTGTAVKGDPLRYYPVDAQNAIPDSPIPIGQETNPPGDVSMATADELAAEWLIMSEENPLFRGLK